MDAGLLLYSTGIYGGERLARGPKPMVNRW